MQSMKITVKRRMQLVGRVMIHVGTPEGNYGGTCDGGESKSYSVIKRHTEHVRNDELLPTNSRTDDYRRGECV